MLYNEGKKQIYLTEILQVKNFEGTKIRTLNLPAWLFFITVTPSLETLASFGFHGSAPTGSQYSGGPSSISYSHYFSHQF